MSPNLEGDQQAAARSSSLLHCKSSLDSRFSFSERSVVEGSSHEVKADAIHRSVSNEAWYQVSDNIVVASAVCLFMSIVEGEKMQCIFETCVDL